jgi:DedD protein
MASKASPEASEIRRRGRQRLIGAVALVLLLVVFVPMLLDSEPKRTQPALSIPSRDSSAPLPAPAPAVASKAAPPPAAVPAVPTEPPKAAAPPVAVPAAPAEPPKPAPKSEPKAAPRLEGFAVQVGAFRDEAKLKQVRDKLVASKVVHYTERLEAPGGPLTRLRAGPFPTREAAEAAQATLKRAALDGKVVPLP